MCLRVKELIAIKKINAVKNFNAWKNYANQRCQQWTQTFWSQTFLAIEQTNNYV